MENETAQRRQLFWAKASYFFFYAAGAALFPVLALYYESLGFSGRQIGVLTAIAPLMTLVGAPLWGGLADLTKRHKPLLALSISGAIVFLIALSTTQRYTWMVVLVALAAFSGAPIMPLIDNTVMEILGSRRGDYGKQRLWGAIGWGISAPLVGVLIEARGLVVAFFSYAALQSFNLISAIQLPISQRSSSGVFGRDLRLLLRNRQWVGFLVMVFIGGISMASISSFLFLYMSYLGASGTLMGLALTVSTISEVPILHYGDRFMRWFGPLGLLAIGMGIFGFRLIGYAVIPEAWMVLPLQLLHGLSFSVVWIAGVSYAAEIAPEGLGATAQGMFSAVIFGLGAAAGGLISGWLYESSGSARMYGWLGVGLLTSLAVYLLVAYFTREEFE